MAVVGVRLCQQQELWEQFGNLNLLEITQMLQPKWCLLTLLWYLMGAFVSPSPLTSQDLLHWLFFAICCDSCVKYPIFGGQRHCSLSLTSPVFKEMQHLLLAISCSTAVLSLSLSLWVKIWFFDGRILCQENTKSIVERDMVVVILCTWLFYFHRTSRQSLSRRLLGWLWGRRTGVTWIQAPV